MDSIMWLYQTEVLTINFAIVPVVMRFIPGKNTSAGHKEKSSTPLKFLSFILIKVKHIHFSFG